MMMQKVSKGQGNWVRQAEHGIVRVGSLALSIVSGHAVYWFFSAMNGVDSIEPYMTWVTASAIGLLGYVILRALTHRLLHKEKVYVYIPLCIILMGVETVSNFMKAVVGVHNDHWLTLCPTPLVQFMTYATYVVLSIMPAFTVFLAYVDMDLERAKHAVGSVVSSVVGSKVSVAGTPAAPAPYVRPSQVQMQPMPKQVPASQYSAVNNGVAPSPYAAIPPYPTMTQQPQMVQGYPPAPAMATVPMPQQPMAQPQPVPQGQGGLFGGIMNNVGRVATAFTQQPTQQP